MLKNIFVSILLLSFIMITPAHASKETTAIQANLDKICEDARDIALQPLRLSIYNECVTKFKKDVNICQEEASAYNGRRINGAPRFYELPACHKAFDFREKTNTENSAR